ncbi:MAG: YtxH domain-containing protein [bacterium]
MDWKKALEQAQRSMTSTYDSGVDAVLDRLGLEPRKSTMEIMLPALGVFGAGIAVGAVLGVLFAPKRGEELRNDIRHRISDIRDRGAEQFEEARARGEQLIDTAREKVDA